jgi:branched-chain amino acid transport system ATP-binding protein
VKRELLRVENLNVFYDGIHALKGISFVVPRGSIVTLIGANGAGKTTTLRAISGLVPPKNGEILFEGKSVLGKETHDVSRMGIIMVPEGRRIFSNLSVRENLIMGSFASNSSRRFEEGLEYVFSLFPRLKERFNQLGGTLSGGEQQMLALGRALISKPKLLMLDEPSLGLAPKITFTLFEKIREIHRRNTTILIIEQNAKAVLKMADYGYVLDTGEIILEGSGENLFLDERVKKAYLGG